MARERKKKEQEREGNKGACTTMYSKEGYRSQKDKFLFNLQFPHRALPLTFKGQRTLALKDFEQKVSSGVLAHGNILLVFTSFKGK